MYIKKFGLLDWVERDLLILCRISTSDDYADALTKATGPYLHYRHFDYILGKHVFIYTAHMHLFESNQKSLSNYYLYLHNISFVFYRRRGGYHTIY